MPSPRKPLTESFVAVVEQLLEADELDEDDDDFEDEEIDDNEPAPRRRK